MVALPSFLAFHQLAQVGGENRRQREEEEVADHGAEVKLEQWLKSCWGQDAAPVMVLCRAGSVRLDLGRIGAFMAWHESWWPSKQVGLWGCRLLREGQRNYKIRCFLPMKCGFVPVREEDRRGFQDSFHLNSKPCSCAMGFLPWASPSKEEVEGNFGSSCAKGARIKYAKLFPQDFPSVGSYCC